MQYSESKNIWNYLVKNLVLLDRCVEDRSFVSDIATMHILHVENFKDPDPKNSKLLSETHTYSIAYIPINVLRYNPHWRLHSEVLPVYQAEKQTLREEELFLQCE